MSYLEVTLEGKIQVQQVLPLLEDPVEVPPGRAEALGHGAVDLGPGLLGEDHLVCLPQQLLHRALLVLQGRHHLHLPGLQASGLGVTGTGCRLKSSFLRRGLKCLFFQHMLLKELLMAIKY